MSTTQINETQNGAWTEAEMRKFLKTYELKEMTRSQIFDIYKKNALNPSFHTSFKSALALIFMPALTNIYYTFRPNSPLNSVLTFTMPLLCILQYAYFIEQDLRRFCFDSCDDAATVRAKFDILYVYDKANKQNQQLAEKIQQFRQKNGKQ